MVYTQIRNVDVMNAVYKGFDVLICLFDEDKMLHTNELTVNAVRNYASRTADIAFFRVEAAS